MWRAATVVPQHRRRANLVWGGLVVTALGYAVWQVTKMVLKRRDPNTSLTISNGVFNFPHVTVCLQHGLGCGFVDESTSGCVATAKRFSYAYVESTEHDTDQQIFPTEGDFGNCVEFDLTVWDKVRHQAGGRARAFVEIFWVSSDKSSAETEYSAGVEVFVGGDISGEEYTTVPYSRTEHPATEEGLTMTVMTIGKTRRKVLSGDSTITYPVLTTTTTNYVTKGDSYFDPSSISDLISSTTSSSSSSSARSSITTASSAVFNATIANLTDQYSTGALHLTIDQGAYSLVEIEDIDPVDVGNLLGNFGGFWELLLLAWGVFYIARYGAEEPTLKARNFVDIFHGGKSQLFTKKRKLSSAQSSPVASVHGDQRPNWGNAGDAVGRSSSSSGTGGRLNKSVQHHGGGGGSAVRASFRRPVGSDRPRRDGDSPITFSVGASGASSGGPAAGSRDGAIERGRSCLTGDEGVSPGGEPIASADAATAMQVKGGGDATLAR